MKPQDFVNTYKEAALKVEKDTGVFAVTILARAAIESGWGQFSPNYNFFGIKDTDGINGNEQLMTTTEYTKSPKSTFPVILSVIPFGKALWKYKIKDYFRKYDNAEQSFADFANFLKSNPRYSQALHQSDALSMGTWICRAGYSTDPNAIKLVIDVSNKIDRLIKT